MFNSLAAWSSSSTMPDARSTFTLRIGPGIIMRPALVKNRDTSLPWSARWAIASAGIGFRGLRALFIKFLLLFRGFPEGDEVVILSFLVLPHLKNNSVQPFPPPADRSVLLGTIQALVKVVRMRENLLSLFEPDASFRFVSQTRTLALIEVKSHEYNSYTTLRNGLGSGF